MLDYRVNVYLRHTEMENMYVRELIDIVAQDTRAYTFKFTLQDDEMAYDLTNKTVYLIVKSPSGTIIQERCNITHATQGLTQITLPNDMFCEAGTYEAEVQIWEGTSRLTSLPFDYSVRLSLQTDKSVIADTRYSLLQEALENVIEAEEKSTAALAKANEAKQMADTQIPLVNKAVADSTAALDRAIDIATKTELDNRITLDGESQENFNFETGKVVQDGLSNSYIGDIKVKTNTGVKITDSVDVTVILDAFFPVNTKLNYIIGNHDSTNNSGFHIRRGLSSKLELNDVASGKQVTSHDVIGRMINLAVTISKNYVRAFVDGEYVCGISITKDSTGSLAINASNTAWQSSEAFPTVSNAYVYSRVLSGNEIKKMNYISKSGMSIKNINDIPLSTDASHILMRDGRTLDQFAYECLDWKTVNGTPDITVDNCKRAWVKNAKISGNTIKNYANTTTMTIVGRSGQWIGARTNVLGIEYNKKYWLHWYVYETDLDVQFTIAQRYATNQTCPNVSTILSSPNLGYYKAEFTSGGEGDFLGIWTQFNSSTTTCTLKYAIAVTDADCDLSGYFQESNLIQFGLSSSKATITANGSPVSFKLDNEVIELNKVDDIVDTLEILGDGSGVLTERNYKRVLTEKSGWVKREYTKDGNTRFSIKLTENYLPSLDGSKPPQLISNNYTSGYSLIGWDVGTSVNVICSHITGSYIYVTVVEQTLETFLNSMKGNNLIIIHNLATPKVTHIPKEQMQSILTQLGSNTFTAGRDIKASALELTVASDEVAALRTELNSIKTLLL